MPGSAVRYNCDYCLANVLTRPDYLRTAFSLTFTVLTYTLRLLRVDPFGRDIRSFFEKCFAPFITLIVMFGIFVTWNGGVVLGIPERVSLLCLLELTRET